MNTPIQTLQALGSSRKVVMLFLVTSALFAMAWTGKLPVADFLSFIKISIPAWMAAQAWEDSQTKGGTTVVNVSDSGQDPKAS